ncbi:MAG: hypothetical protein EA403_03590 [Spirochaetaceae bacterium]|nr:MAG: hypothetical protein EA403_03590 [Spirochaetaceae bacterium]
MEISRDLKELLELFRSHGVECVVVGAHALALHGLPRFTADLDLLLNRSRDNADRIMRALTDFGFGDMDLTPEDFLVPDQVIQLGHSPNRVDLLTSISGVNWDAAVSGALDGAFGDTPVRFLGREELIKNKRATGRRKDLADVEALLDQSE